MSESNYPDCSWMPGDTAWDKEKYDVERVFPADHGPVCKGHLRARYKAPMFRSSIRPSTHNAIKPLEEYL